MSKEGRDSKQLSPLTSLYSPRSNHLQNKNLNYRNKKAPFNKERTMLHETNSMSRAEAIVLLLEGLQHLRELILGEEEDQAEPIDYVPVYGPILKRLKVTPRLKGQLKKSADKIAEKAVSIFSYAHEKTKPTVLSMAQDMHCDSNRVYAILKNLIHYGLIRVDEPTKKGERWSIEDTGRFRAKSYSDLVKMLEEVFKRPFAPKRVVGQLSVCCQMAEDDPE